MQAPQERRPRRPPEYRKRTSKKMFREGKYRATPQQYHFTIHETCLTQQKPAACRSRIKV